MYLLSLFAPLLLPFVFATPLSLAPTQLLNLNSLTTGPLSPTNINTTSLGAEIACFRQTKIPPFIATNKISCEAALDDWVRGQSLIRSRTFSRHRTSSSTPDDVLLPFQKVSGSCMIYADVANDGDEDVLTLAEIYAELLGPDGVMKQCLGQRRLPAIGGRMVFGAKGVLRIMVTGVEIGGVVAEN